MAARSLARPELTDKPMLSQPSSRLSSLMPERLSHLLLCGVVAALAGYVLLRATLPAGAAEAGEADEARSPA